MNVCNSFNCLQTRHHIRKSSRKNTNEDLFLMLLIVSFDLYISLIRNLKTKQIQEFSDEVKILFLIENEK